MKKKDHVQSFLDQGSSEADEPWIKLFLETEELDQLLYYLDLSLLSMRAKFKILRSLKIESIAEITPETLVIILEDSWVRAKPYDQFLKKGSFIWTEETLTLKQPITSYQISPTGLEAILPWVIYKVEKESIENKIPSSNFYSVDKGPPFHKFISHAIVILAILIAIIFFVQSNSIKLANSGAGLDSTQLQGLYLLLISGSLIICFFPFQSFSWDHVSGLISGFMKNFKLERFNRGRRTNVRFNSLISLLDLISPEKAIIPLTAFMSLVVSISFLYDNLIGVAAVIIFGGIYFIQHLSLESRAKTQLANTLSAQSFFLDTYRSLPLLASTARKNNFMDPLKIYWQSLSENYASTLYEKDKSALWYQARLALIRTVLVQFVFLVMVLVLGLNYLDYVSFSAIQIALTVITGPTHDLFKRLKDYTHFSVLSSMFSSNDIVECFDTFQEIKCEQLRLFGPESAEINFAFESTKIYSIIGKTGSGKSELTRILTSMTTFSEGSLQVNGKTIKPGQKWRLKSIFINEELHWRGGKLLDYLTGKDPQVDIKRLRIITEDLGLDKKILLLKDGYDTEVGEVNLPFSHAEQMLLSLTRAIYSNYNAIVLDNVLNRADKNFQKIVFEYLRKHSAGRIFFIIDNNFEIITDSDYAIIVDQGAIVDHGPPNELVVISDKLKTVSRPTRYFL
ncbi:MAG: ATP-binding cassette domain-containing protein [Bdellovibrionales bacterium]|nr:ATP-binding cassette domain-containing protein [Bdellovibrionales bacterium]